MIDASGPIMPTNQKPLRPLGCLENYECALHATGRYTCALVACRYRIPAKLVAPERQQTLEDHVEAAVARTVAQHTMLQAVIAAEDSWSPAWAAVPQLDLSNHIRWQLISGPTEYDAALEKLLASILSRKFTELDTRPAWDVYVLRRVGSNQMDVIFSCSHACSDGTGDKLFHQTLIRHLANLSEADEMPKLDGHKFASTLTADNLAPPQEAVANFSISLGFFATAAWKEYTPHLLLPKSPLDATWAPVRQESLTTEVRGFSIPHETLQKALLACRKHRTTLTGLIQAITLTSLASQLSAEQAPGMRSNTAINIRRFVPERPPAHPTLNVNDTLSNFVTMMSHEMGEPLVSRMRRLAAAAATADGDGDEIGQLEAGIWEVAGSFRAEIQAKLERGLRDDVVGLMSFVFDWKKRMRHECTKPRPSAWLVTNLGVLDAPAAATDSRDGWAITRARFALSGHTLGPLFTISPISVPGGELSVDVTWQKEAVDAKMGDKLASDLHAWLRRAGSAVEAK